MHSTLLFVFVGYRLAQLDYIFILMLGLSRAFLNTNLSVHLPTAY